MKFFKKLLFTNLFILFTLAAYSQLIPLTLIGKDGRNGMQLKPKFEVKSLKTNFELPVSVKDNNSIVKVSKNDRIIIKATLDGYYTNEKLYEIDDSFSDEGRNIVVDLDPQPSLNLQLIVVDKVNGKSLDSKIQLIQNNQTIYAANSDKKNSITKLVVTAPGTYKVKIEAEGYNVYENDLKLEVSDPPALKKETIELGKIENSIILQIVNSANEPLNGVNVKITDAKNKVLKSGILQNGKQVLQYGDAKEIFVDVSANGFFNHTEKINIVQNETYTIKLKNKSLFNINVMDITSGKRVVADVTIMAKGGKITNIKSSSEHGVEYFPDEEGLITITAKAVGFQDYESKYTIKSSSSPQPIDIKLLSVFEEYLIFVLDENKKPIENCSVRVNDASGRELPIDYKQSTGEWSVRLEKGKQYELIASAAGYDIVKQELSTAKGKLIGVTLSKKQANFSISVLDEYLKTPVKAKLIIKPDAATSIEKETNEKGEVSFSAKTNKNISVQVVADNYVEKTANLSFESAASQQLNLVRKGYETEFLVLNASTNEKLNFEVFTIKNNANGSLKSFEAGKQTIFAIEPNQLYEVLVKKNGFTELQQTVNANTILASGKLTYEVKLTPKAYVEHTIEVVDEVTKKVIPNVKIRAFTASENYSAIPMDTKWKVSVKNNVPYTLEVTAPDYGTKSKTNDQFDETTYIVLLTKNKEVDIQFEAFDEVLNLAIPAKFSLLVDDKLQDLSLSLGGTKAKTKLQEGKKYSIRVSANDYRDVEQAVAFPTTANETVRINFKKDLYPVKFYVLDEKGTRIIKEPSFKVLDNKGLETRQNFVFDKMMYEVFVKPSTDYKLLIDADGYEKQEIQFTLEELAKTKSEKLIKLKPLETEKVIKEIVPEKPVEEKPVEVKKEIKVEVIPEKKEEVKPPVVVEKPKPTVFDINALNLVDLPAEVSTIKSAFAAADAKSKKFVLTQVHFDQSSPVMQETSYPQLKQVLEVLRGNDKIRIQLVGHTDDRGDKRQNLYLSEFRAKVVSNYLFNNGIDYKRIITKGLGQDFPIAPNDSEENRAKNRRVELIVLEN